MSAYPHNGATRGAFQVVGDEVRAASRLELESLFGKSVEIFRTPTEYTHEVDGQKVSIKGEWFFVRLASHQAACRKIGIKG